MWMRTFYTSIHEKVTIGGKKCKLTGIYDESDDFRFAQATASVMNPGSKIGINWKSRLVNLVLLPLRYGNKDIIRDNISECHRR